MDTLTSLHQRLRKNGAGRWWVRLFALLLLPIGLFLLGGGGQLIVLGGSAYYAIAGTIVLLAAFFVSRNDPRGDITYAALLAITLLWAVWESGRDPWALMPRLAGPAILGLAFLLPAMPRSGYRWVSRCGWSGALAVPMLLGLVAGFAALFVQPSSAAPARWTTTMPAETDWAHYGQEAGGSRFAPVAQINAGNADRLQRIWEHHSREAPHATASLESTPLKIGAVVYTCTASSTVIALDARNGRELWRHDPRIKEGDYATRTCRSLAYFSDAGAIGRPCSARIFSTTLDGRLVALDAPSGALCKTFGDNGYVALQDGFGKIKNSHTYSTSGPAVVGDRIIVGGLVLDNQKIDMPSGVIRAYDVHSGALIWAWDMGAPDRPGAPPPGQRYTPSTPNAWAPLTTDPALGLVFLPLGNPSPDFYGVRRRPFDEKYGSSVVALSVEDGRPRWSFQTVHHDLWDYDVPMQPSLADLDIGGRRVPALVQGTKQGDIFILDRRTGKPLLPVLERTVPQGAIAGEPVSPTQPSSAISLAPPPLTESAMWGITPLDQMICRIRFRKTRYEGRYTPPNTDYSLVYPGLTGTMNWGGLSIDEDRQIAIANISMVPWRVRLVPRKQVSAAVANASWTPLMIGTPYAWEQEPFLGPLAVPCNQPPWGRLTAVNLRSGRTLWSRPLGTARDSGPLGLGFGPPIPVGVPNVGGAVTTRGDVTFIAGTMDRYIRAFDTRNGAELWKARLPAGGQATPMTYMAAGRQYLVVSAGGHAILGTRKGDVTLAFALPKPEAEQKYLSKEGE